MYALRDPNKNKRKELYWNLFTNYNIYFFSLSKMSDFYKKEFGIASAIPNKNKKSSKVKVGGIKNLLKK